jgi:acyl-CoA dehydrogenase
MQTLITLIIFLGAISSLAFFKVPQKISFIVTAALLATVSFFSLWSWWLLIPAWLVFLSLAALFNVPVLRQQLLSRRILNYVRNVLPPISRTEREALAAGDVWWEGELFRGKPNWQLLLKQPKPQLTADEQAFLNNQVETLCGLLSDWQIVQHDLDLSEKAWRYIKEEGFLGLVIDKEYGGKGFSALAHATIVSKIATRSMSAAVDIMVPNSLGPGELVQTYGTFEQKKYYLPRLALGQEIPCFGLTGLEAGSDATAMTDTGIVCRGEYNGETILGIRLNWSKRYITLAPIATLLGLAFKLYDPEHLLGEKEDLGITVCLVSTDHSGVVIGNRHRPLNLSFMNGPISGENVFVPLDAIVGGPERCGKGWQMLMESLAIGRGISLPALSTAAVKLSYRMTGAYARVRKQFRMSIGKLEGVQEALARIGGFTYICEATSTLTAQSIDLGKRPSLASAITKYHLTELMRKAVNDAMDVHGGKGIQLGPKNYLGLLYLAVPTAITVEGANILTRNLMIFGQGALRCHPYLRDEMAAAEDTNTTQGLIKFDKLLNAHIAYLVSNFVRSFAFGLSAGRFIPTENKGPVANYYRQLTRMSAALAFVSDVALGLLGGQLKRKERLSARLGDVLSHLYMGSAVLRYFENQGQPSSDLPFVHWTLQYCLANIQTAFDEFFVNFPHRWLARILRRLVFPWGRSYRFPADVLGQRIADEMLKPSAMRDRLTQHCYLGADDNDAVRQMENTLQALTAAEPIRMKLQNAIRSGRVPRHGTHQEQIEAAVKAGILTADEIQLLASSHALYLEALQVDEFSPNTFARKSTDGKKSKSKFTE